jgi:DNA replication protein DnaC
MVFMFGFSKHCQVCGIDVKKETAIKRFGRYLCCEEHAEKFVSRIKEEERLNKERRRERRGRSGGCC